MTTKAQKIHLNAELWPAACRQQGWSPKDREKLYDVYARVLGEREPYKSKLAEPGGAALETILRERFKRVRLVNGI